MRRPFTPAKTCGSVRGNHCASLYPCIHHDRDAFFRKVRGEREADTAPFCPAHPKSRMRPSRKAGWFCTRIIAYENVVEPVFCDQTAD